MLVHAHPKITEATFRFAKFVKAYKKSVLSQLFILDIQPILESPWPDWPNPLLAMPTPIFDQNVIFLNFYQHAKNQALSSVCSTIIVDLKSLQSDWLRALRPISQEKDFSQIWDMCRNTANNFIIE